MDGIKVSGKGPFEVVLAEIKVKTNGTAIRSIDVDAGAVVREFVGGIVGTDVVPPGLGAEDGGSQIIGGADIRAGDGVEDQSEDAAAGVIRNRSTDGWLAGCEVEAEGPDVIADGGSV